MQWLTFIELFLGFLFEKFVAKVIQFNVLNGWIKPLDKFVIITHWNFLLM